MTEKCVECGAVLPASSDSIYCARCDEILDKKFEKIETGDLLCPRCGSLPRTRRLNKLLDEKFLKDGFAVLDFSP